MASSYKPMGFPSVSAYIMAKDARAVIDFATKVFGATPERGFDGPDGRIMHVELRIEDSVVMLADAHGDWPSFPSWLHVYVPDVDNTYQRALAAGGTSVQPHPAAGRRSGPAWRRRRSVRQPVVDF